MALRLRIERRRPPLPRFSSSSSPYSNGNDDDPQPSSISSHFSDVKAILKNQHSGDHPLRRSTPHPSFLSRPPQQQQQSPEILAGLQKQLSEFRSRIAPPSGPSFHKPSLQKANADPSRNAAKVSWDGIKESLRGISDHRNAGGAAGSGSVDRMSRPWLTGSLRLPAEGDNAVPGRSASGDDLPLKIFGKEIKEKREGKQKEDLEKTRFTKIYAYEELGEKLRMLRSPADEGKKAFSLAELKERLVMLKEMEEKEMESKHKNPVFCGLETLRNIKLDSDEKTKSDIFHWSGILGSLGGMPNFMIHPPKENLFDKYFHPDNMSSSANLKIQLAKVREEFKMSESDCGSARVQVAQLTTKIKHLASVLHKKDKHSRKGLEQMVQRRKRLLKYLRNTDWDSYTMVLSRLGLRDNAELRC